MVARRIQAVTVSEHATGRGSDLKIKTHNLYSVGNKNSKVTFFS
jgi:hypothetical protein